MQNRALELANVPDRVDHRSHQRQGIEQEPTVHIGPSAKAMDGRDGQVAAREGRAYELVKAGCEHKAGVVARGGPLRHVELVERGERSGGREGGGTLNIM